MILHVLCAEPDDKKNLAHIRRLIINIEPTLWAMKNTLHRRRPDLSQPDGFARDAEGDVIPEVHPEVLLGARALESLDYRVRSNVLATARAALNLWADPMVDYATSWSDFQIGDLVCSKNPISFYITTPQAHADRLAFLVRVFTRQTINSLMEKEHFDSPGRRKLHRMLLLLDEFPKLGALPFYFHEKPAEYEQLRGKADLPGTPQIDWLGVTCFAAAPPMPAPRKGVGGLDVVVQAAAEALDEEYMPLADAEGANEADAGESAFDADGDDDLTG